MTEISVTPTTPTTPRLVVKAADSFNYAAWQNSVPMLHTVAIDNSGGSDRSSLTVELKVSPDFAREKRWAIDRIGASETLTLKDVDLDIDPRYLNSLDEAERGVLTFQLIQNGVVLHEVKCELRVLARDEWGGMPTMGELLPAFVTPNDPALAVLLKSAASVLDQHGHSTALDGYQSDDPNRAYLLAAAIWSAVAGRSLVYANPPGSFERTGQKVRHIRTVLSDGLATCLDTSLLLASCLEAIGLNSVLVMTDGHCFAGVWLVKKSFKRLVERDCSELRKAIASKELIVFETTMVTHRPPARFPDAVTAAAGAVSEEKEHEFVAVIDVARARMSQVLPLASHGTREEGIPEDFESGPPPLPAAPGYDILPAVETEERPQTSAGRIERWQRKLLDLSLRNRLLNFRPSRQAVPVLCPDISQLEDRLAGGARLRLVSLAEGHPVAQRSAELHQKRTQKDLNEEFAKQALARNEIACPVESRDLDTRLTALFRKVRNDLAEGGSNTLYLAVGFLRWKQSPTDEKSYRAPLLLVPVQLIRRSAASPFYLANHEDDVRFNATLLQLLKKDFDCDLTGFEAALPTDDSGVDVPQVLSRMRQAVRDIPGFEVIEEAAIAPFSFAKYLMWKDLVDRIGQLEHNRVVRHLIHNPDKAFRSGAGVMPRPHEIDVRYAPQEIVHPLPADSSQLAAVMAASEGHDLVIVGPPGTGKSQTIANIIAQCLAVRKSVLFVAEKTAALDVVYRRLREHGLGDCCVELHSNKAERRRFLSQLETSWKNRSAGAESDWISITRQLRVCRDQLNDYAAAVHTPAANGWTPYRAMGECVRGRQQEAPRLTWPATVRHDRKQFEQLQATVADLATTFQAIAVDAALPRVQATEWSMAWETELLESCHQLEIASVSLSAALAAFSTMLTLPTRTDATASELSQFDRLARELTQATVPPAELLFHDQLDQLDDALDDRQDLLRGCDRVKAALEMALGQFCEALGTSSRVVPDAMKPTLYLLASELVRQDLPPAELVFHRHFESLGTMLAARPLLLQSREQAFEALIARSFTPSLIKRIPVDDLEREWSSNATSLGFLPPLTTSLEQLQAELEHRRDFLHRRDMAKRELEAQLAHFYRALGTASVSIPDELKRPLYLLANELVRADLPPADLVFHTAFDTLRRTLAERSALLLAKDAAFQALETRSFDPALVDRIPVDELDRDWKWVYESSLTLSILNVRHEGLLEKLEERGTLLQSRNRAKEAVNSALIRFCETLGLTVNAVPEEMRRGLSLLAAELMQPDMPPPELAFHKDLKRLRSTLADRAGLLLNRQQAFEALETRSFNPAIIDRIPVDSMERGWNRAATSFWPLSRLSSRSTYRELKSYMVLGGVADPAIDLPLLCAYRDASVRLKDNLASLGLPPDLQSMVERDLGALEPWIQKALRLQEAFSAVGLSPDTTRIASHSAVTPLVDAAHCVHASTTEYESLCAALSRNLSELEVPSDIAPIIEKDVDVLDKITVTIKRRCALTRTIGTYMAVGGVADPAIDLPLLCAYRDASVRLKDNLASLGLPPDLQSMVERDLGALEPWIQRAARLREAIAAAGLSLNEVSRASHSDLGNLVGAARRLYPPGHTYEAFRTKLKENLGSLSLPPEIKTRIERDSHALDAMIEEVKRRRALNANIQSYMGRDGAADATIDLPLLCEYRDAKLSLTKNLEALSLSSQLQTVVERDAAALDRDLENAARLREAMSAAGFSPGEVAMASQGSLKTLAEFACRVFPMRREYEAFVAKLKEHLTSLSLSRELSSRVESDAVALDSQIDTARTIRDAISSIGVGEALGSKTIQTILEMSEQSRRESAGVFSQSLKAFQDAWADYTRLARITPAEEDSASMISDASVEAHRLRSRRTALKPWLSWLAVRQRADQMGLSGFVEALHAGKLQPADAVARFRLAYARWWLPGAVDRREPLRAFQRLMHEGAVKEFSRLDDLARDAAAPRARHAVLHGLPPSDEVPRKSELGLLRHQMSLKRPSKSIREVISGMPETFGKLAPCLLMSPLSIAQYLPADQALFDVVVFDEASQIATWDAIGAIARGRQTIIVGDPKQLPPTNFFGRADGDEDNAELEDHEKDLESILDEAQASGLPTLQLNWHYRSRHESLIAFSNWNYYGNHLVTFPAAESADRGVSLRHVEGAVYDRGKSRTNRQEAEAIVAEAVARMRRCLKRPEADRLTYGVVTFNSQQQELIQDLFDDAQRRHPDLEWFFADDRIEPTVVKNLENVQGDERDVMMFSITFGFDAAGKFPIDFGAINRDGGERRLNVAVTRARRELLVFASFLPEQLRAERSSARGVHDLKAFLEYAEKGPQAIAARIDGLREEHDSPLEEAIAGALEARGWRIDPQVGVSGFRIDLGVVHPDRPGAYLAGVECDGATYHRSAVARDRDKTRQQVLENLGWTLFRIWSTDWWYDPETAIERLDGLLTERLQHSRDEEAQAAARAAIDEEQNAAVAAPIEAVDESSKNAGSAGWADASTEGADAESEEPAASLQLIAQQSSQQHLRTYSRIDLGDAGAHQDRFFDEGYSDALRRMAMSVLESHGPIRDDVLAREVARAHGFGRTSSRIKQRVLELLPDVTTTEESAGTFLWPGPTVPESVPFRYAIDDGEHRSLDEIAMPELIGLVREHPLLATSDDPALALARAIGLARLSRGARSRLEEALEACGSDR